MAARKRLYHPDEVREKIRTSQLVNRLNDFVMGKINMAPHQVTAALGLIRKTMPDLANVDLNLGGSAELKIRWIKGDDERPR